jgi:NMD protein affecting ribosome stability and mRNA decay
MTEEKTGKHTGKCYDCGKPLELYEMDMKKSTKIMVCRSCGLFHYYEKNFVGNYRLRKVTKNPETKDTSQSPNQ